MTNAPSVAILAYDGLCTFEFGCAVELFALPRPEIGGQWYRTRVVSAEGPRVSAMGGITVEAEADLEALADADLIVVPGWRDRNEVPPPGLIDAISSAADRGAEILTICSGVFVLAATGRLDGRHATTHWRHVGSLRRQYPKVVVEPDAIYVESGPFVTSAGSAAGLDAGLHVIRRRFGAKVANQVARRLVVPAHRDGGQAQFIPAPVPKLAADGIGRAIDHARRNLDQDLTIAGLARIAAMSERSFLRRFRAATGAAPLTWLNGERIARARDLLETTSLPLDAVAAAAGFAAPETFRSRFRAVTGVSPSAYRARFRDGATLPVQDAAKIG